MNLEIIKKYRLNFQNKISHNRQVDKMAYTNSKTLNIFLYYWTADKINNSLLPDINDVLNDIHIEIESGTEYVDILIKKDVVDFMFDYSLELSIPTIDFKQIVEGWRDFLLSSPLCGTQM